MGRGVPDGGRRRDGARRLNGAARRAFIVANTAVHLVPHAPELRLHLADEAVSLWQRTEEELAEEGLPPPFWAFAWAGGQGLARWLLDHGDEVAGRSVLDFASGSGVAGVAAARAGAIRVRCVDIDPFCASAAALNAELNDVAVETATDDVIGRDRSALGAPDIVLVGDAHYERGFAARSTPWLEGLAGEGARVIVGDPGRSYFPRDRGWREIARYEVPVIRDLEDREVRSVGVWEVPASRSAG